MGICCSRKTDAVVDCAAHIQPVQALSAIASKRNSDLPTTAFTSQSNIRDSYQLGKVFGHGHFGTVRVAKHKITGKKFAVKTIEKKKVMKDLHVLKREVEILQNLDHPNLIVTFATYEDPKYLHIVTELCTGGELLEKLIAKTRYKEREAALIMRQILLAVNHLHEHGICHRDLKPENFLFASTEKNADLKLIDFGLANKFGNKFWDLMSSVVGTPYYVAPEVLSGGYGPQCDIWSVGIIMFMLLSGKPPFEAQTTNGIFKKILSDTPKFTNSYWAEVSVDAKYLITAMLQKNPLLRPTAKDVLDSQWFRTRSSAVITISPSVLDSLINYKSESKFKKAALGVIVKNLSIAEIKELKEAFIAMDIDNSGELTFDDIETGLKNQGYHVAGDKIALMLANPELSRTGRINYSDFLTMTISSKAQLISHSLWDTFKVLDIDNTGFITADNLKQAFHLMGKDYDDTTVAQMVAEADTEKPDMITFEEFRALFSKV
jgi:calcium-dependent protein kinase